MAARASGRRAVALRRREIRRPPGCDGATCRARARARRAARREAEVRKRLCSWLAPHEAPRLRRRIFQVIGSGNGARGSGVSAERRQCPERSPAAFCPAFAGLRRGGRDAATRALGAGRRSEPGKATLAQELRCGTTLPVAGLDCGAGALCGPSPLPLSHRMGEGEKYCGGRNPGRRSFLASRG
jgi:hypothetical protein